MPEEWVWSRDRGDDRPHEVAESQPNPWGLNDMHGNAMEWCLDDWTEYPKKKNEVTVDPVKIGRPDKETTFVVRGGAWWLPADQCTSHEVLPESQQCQWLPRLPHRVGARDSGPQGRELTTPGSRRIVLDHHKFGEREEVAWPITD